ncbi:MAG: hydroxyacid dehydrogenase [Acidimicrobiales bacterium]|nr:hydroxyacid dehydrogenase [Acidimicrobiales bacterium]MDG2216780.1 hydroxyacid dehydrogenase [Acidimicrobiales bacterium]
MTKPRVAVTIGRSNYGRMFSERAWEQLNDIAIIVHHDDDEPANHDDLLSLLPGVRACITSWGVAQLNADVIAAAESLELMSHMGSSIKRFVSEPLWDRGVRVTSAGITLARDVAETTLGLMIVGRKRIWPLSRHVAAGGWRDSAVWGQWDARELTRSTVGLVGASNVGRHVIDLLQPFESTILVADPFLSEDNATALGVERVDLAELAARSDVVSLHCPENEHTRHMINAEILASMQDGVVLINTARGGLIDETALINELEQNRIFAFLDVTDPEPPALDSPLRLLDNVVVTPHIAGCIENCNRMGELAVEEVRRHLSGEPAVYEIRRDMLDRIS